DPADDHERGAAATYSYWFGLPLTALTRFTPGDRPAGVDSFIASAEDMSHYLIAQLNGGVYRDRRVLSPAGIAMLHQPATPTDTLGGFYAMGWGLSTMNGVPVVAHNGNWPGIYADMALAPESGWGVIVLMNGRPNLQVEAGDERIRAIMP